MEFIKFMLKDERQSKIMKYLDLNQVIKIKDISKKLGVSEETIRKDLIKLENLKLLDRTRGGAVVKDKENVGISNLAKNNLCKREKKYIANLAISYINTKNTIFLDNSTTCQELARLIYDRELYVNIVTNSLGVSNIVGLSDNINLYILAGKYNKHSNSFMGSMTIDNVDNFKADLAFVSFATVSYEWGFGDNNFENLVLRKKMLENAKKSFVLMDYTKFSDDSAKVFEKIKEIDAIITDNKTSCDKINLIENSGVRVVRDRI